MIILANGRDDDYAQALGMGGLHLLAGFVLHLSSDFVSVLQRLPAIFCYCQVRASAHRVFSGLKSQ